MDVKTHRRRRVAIQRRVYRKPVPNIANRFSDKPYRLRVLEDFPSDNGPWEDDESYESLKIPNYDKDSSDDDVHTIDCDQSSRKKKKKKKKKDPLTHTYTITLMKYERQIAALELDCKNKIRNLKRKQNSEKKKFREETEALAAEEIAKATEIHSKKRETFDAIVKELRRKESELDKSVAKLSSDNQNYIQKCDKLTKTKEVLLKDIEKLKNTIASNQVVLERSTKQEELCKKLQRELKLLKIDHSKLQSDHEQKTNQSIQEVDTLNAKIEELQYEKTQMLEENDNHLVKQLNEELTVKKKHISDLKDKLRVEWGKVKADVSFNPEFWDKKKEEYIGQITEKKTKIEELQRTVTGFRNRIYGPAGYEIKAQAQAEELLRQTEQVETLQNLVNGIIGADIPDTPGNENFQGLILRFKMKLTTGPVVLTGDCICGYGFKYSPTERLQCGHSFCLVCVKEMESNQCNVKCPHCRDHQPSTKKFPRKKRR